MKKLCLLLLCCLLLTGCASVGNPLEQAEATPVPCLPMTLHSAEAPLDNADKMEITLFYRYQESGMLGSETRSITVPKDESPEMVTVRQLLAGPQASHTDLTRLFPHNTSVVNVTAGEDTLYITLSEDLLSDAVPQQWQDDPAWQQEAPLRRKLTMQSLAATMTENFSYPYIQVLISYNRSTSVSMRLENSYFLDGRTGLADRLTRDERLLLTMQNTALTILKAWQERDYELLYRFTVAEHDEMPAYADFVEQLDSCAMLTDYSASAGHVAAGSRRATVTLDLTYRQDGQEQRCAAYPLWLDREDNIWKISYESLLRLMQPKN